MAQGARSTKTTDHVGNKTNLERPGCVEARGNCLEHRMPLCLLASHIDETNRKHNILADTVVAIRRHHKRLSGNLEAQYMTQDVIHKLVSISH